MRILAFSDLHRDREAAQNLVVASASADVVAGAGDFATHGHGMSDTLEILAAITVPLIVIAGNHDDLDELRAEMQRCSNVHVLHGEAITLSGTTFFGLGFEIGVKPGALPQSIIDETEAARLLNRCPQGTVLITHSPPFGLADVQRDGSHQGSHAIRDCIEKSAPVLNLCGHIHNAWGTSGRAGNCRVHNLGPTVNWFDA